MTELKKNSSDILGYEGRLKQKEDLINDLERDPSSFRGDYYYNQQTYLLFEPKSGSLNRNASNINGWKSTGIHNDGATTDLISVANLSNALRKLLNQNNRLGITFTGNLLKQDKIAYYHGEVANIYIVYKLQKKKQ